MTQDRFHAMDAARAIALLCGIVLHATVSFSPSWASTGTPLVDIHQSLFLEGLFHVLHSFRMLLFFLIAGFFANLLLQHRGTREFWRNRLRRIGVPLVAGWFVLMPLLAAPIVLAVYVANGGFPGDGRGMAMVREAGIPLGHLWFLYYLLIFYAVSLAAIALLRGLHWNARLGSLADAFVRLLVNSHAVVVLMPIPVTIALYRSADWIPWTGIPSPILGLVPLPAAVVAFGSAFVLGWLLYRQHGLLQRWAHAWPVHAVLGLAANLVAIHLLGSGQLDAFTTDSERFVYILCYTFAGWNLALAVAGFCLRHVNAPSRTWRYLADASYWMYLVHMPLIMLLQAAMLRWAAPWPVKYLLILVISSALLLLSYQYMVRYTFIGKWLNGKRQPRTLFAPA